MQRDHRPPPAKPAEGSIAQPIHPLHTRGWDSHRRPSAKPMGSTVPPKHQHSHRVSAQDGHQSPAAKPWGLTIPQTPYCQVLAAYSCQHRPNASHLYPERRYAVASVCCNKRNLHNFCNKRYNNTVAICPCRTLPKQQNTEVRTRERFWESRRAQIRADQSVTSRRYLRIAVEGGVYASGGRRVLAAAGL